MLEATLIFPLLTLRTPLQQTKYIRFTPSVAVRRKILGL